MCPYLSLVSYLMTQQETLNVRILIKSHQKGKILVDSEKRLKTKTALFFLVWKNRNHKEPMNYGEGGIRTLGTLLRVQRISNQPLSATQPPLHEARYALGAL